jgi:nucleoside-diphosphate-sugar epimerase
MRLVVTGATGFVGAEVMKQTASTFPGEVVGIARTVPSDEGNIRYVKADLRDQKAVERLMAQLRATHLLHLAWDVTPGQYWGSASNLEWLEASLRLFRLFVETGGERIVASGTCAEYDWSDQILIEERTALRPNSLYGTAKNCLREMLEAAAAQFDVSWAWGRLFWLYGPGERRGRLLSDMADAILAGNEFATSSGRQRLDYTHVSDAARALLHLLRSEHEGVVNIGSGEAIEVRQIAIMFAEKLGRPDLLRVGERAVREGEPTLVVADVARLAAIGFPGARDIDTGLSETADWWKRNNH